MHSETPPRIATITGSLSRSGGGLFESVPGLNLALGELGFHCFVFGHRDAFTEQDAHKWGTTPTKPLTIINPGYARYPIRLFDELRAFEPDLVHQHFLWQGSSLIVRRYARRFQIPYLVSPRGMLDKWAFSHKWVRKRLAWWMHERSFVQNASVCHVLNDQEANAVRSLGITTPIVVIPNAVRVAPRELSKASDGPKFLLFLGRLNSKKGIRELLQAWSTAKSKTADTAWGLKVVGWDDGEGDWVRSAIAKGNEKSVELCAPVYGEAKSQLFGGVHALVLPSYSEGLPNSVLEAWGHGLPVLMSRACNLPEGFEKGAAIEANPGDESLTAALCKLFQLPSAELASMGVSGRSLVEEKYSWEIVGKNMARVYDWILGRGNEPSDLLYGK